MSEPIFNNLSQALHISFLLEGMPESSISPTKLAIDSLKLNAGVSSEPSERKVNTQGLKRLEIRGEYSFIRANVEHHLPEPEKNAIWARYGTVNAKYKVFRKVQGVQAMACYVENFCKVKGDALLSLCANFYNLQDEHAKYMTLQQIATEYNVQISKLARAKQVIGANSAKLEDKAFSKLYPLLQKHNCFKEVA